MIDYMSWLDYKQDKDGPNILVYAGQWDNRDGPTTIEPWITNTFNFKAKDLYALDRQLYYINSTTNGLYVGGYFRRTPNEKFTLMTIPKAGHYVPTNVLEVTQWMLYEMVNRGGLLGCHHSEGCDTKHITCNFMNYCSGHGSCSTLNGAC